MLCDVATAESGARYAAQVFDADAELIAHGPPTGIWDRVLYRVSHGEKIEVEIVSEDGAPDPHAHRRRGQP